METQRRQPNQNNKWINVIFRIDANGMDLKNKKFLIILCSVIIVLCSMIFLMLGRSKKENFHNAGIEYQKETNDTFAADVSIGYTLDRVDEFFGKFSIKLSGDTPYIDSEGLKRCFEKFISSKSKEECIDELETIRKLATDVYRLEYSSGILLFLVSFYANVQEPEEAIKMLEIVVASKDPVWASMAQCIIAKIYEEYLKDKVKAPEAYSKILLDFPDSLEVSYASRALKRL